MNPSSSPNPQFQERNRLITNQNRVKTPRSFRGRAATLKFYKSAILTTLIYPVGVEIFERLVRISREGLGEIRLRDSDVAKIEALSRNNPEHYFFFELMFRRGFRVSAITGDRARRVKYAKQVKVQRSDETIQLVEETITKTYPASRGIRKEDVTPEGVSVIWKGGERNFRYLPNDLATELYAYASTLRKNGKVVGFTRQRGYQLCQEYAKRAGISDWKRVHPHRFRHYFGTFHARRTGRDPWKVSSLMGHKDLRATRVYVEELSPEEEKAELG